MVLTMDKDMKLSFGDWLGLRRKHLGISQAEIAEKLGLRSQTISNWERDRTLPTLTPDQTATLCEILQVSIEYLQRASKGEIETSE